MCVVLLFFFVIWYGVCGVVLVGCLVCLGFFFMFGDSMIVNVSGIGLVL